NVNWTAISDQNWLSLSFVKLAQGKSAFNTISGNGDAKITLVAETNNTGNNRSANILISGDNSVATRTVAVTQTGILGSQESKLFVTVLYPNPTSDILNIQTEQKISRVEIYDTAGKLVKAKSGNENKIGISQLTNGLYFIKIYSDGAVINSKFIKN
ncbi:MAG: T9SS type A sorting domain-containing protein, partial [Chryseobacterium sp.]